MPYQQNAHDVARLPGILPSLRLGKAVHAALQSFHLARWRGGDDSPDAVAVAYEAAFLRLEREEGPVNFDAAASCNGVQDCPEFFPATAPVRAISATLTASFSLGSIYPPGAKNSKINPISARLRLLPDGQAKNFHGLRNSLQYNHSGRILQASF